MGQYTLAVQGMFFFCKLRIVWWRWVGVVECRAPSAGRADDAYNPDFPEGVPLPVLREAAAAARDFPRCVRLNVAGVRACCVLHGCVQGGKSGVGWEWESSGAVRGWLG